MSRRVAPSGVVTSVTVAESGTLPQLDLSTNITWFGLQDDFGDSMSEIGEGDFINYVQGANVGGFIKVADAMLAYGVL